MRPSRRQILRLLGLGLASLATRRWSAAAEPMGSSYPISDHFDGRYFFNPGGRAPRGLGALLRWQLGRQRGPWPEWIENRATPALPDSLAPRECAITFVNHASFLLQLPGLNVLTDPIWSERCSPVTWAGPRRVRAPGLAFERLPRIDVVLVSHNHYDHLDLATLRRLHAAQHPLIVTALGNRPFLARAGLDRVVELDWWQEHAPRPGVTITFTPAQHFAARSLGDRNETLWGGFVVRTAAGRLYFAGDSGYWNGFKEVGARLGPFDVSFLPIGAYEPRWFMEPVHCNPDEAIRIHREVRTRRSLAMHFGCFPLADDGFQQPVDDFLAARAAAGVGSEEFILPEVGETRRLLFT